MMIKKIMGVLLLICILFSFGGCSALNIVNSYIEPTESIFKIDSYHLQITADSTFEEETGGDFDLQITNGDCYISVMAYKQIDISDDLTPLDVFDIQNEDLFSRRTNVNVIEEAKTQTLSQKNITKKLYSAEKDNVKNYYATYLIDFPDDKTFAWVLVSAIPSYLDENQEYVHNIVCSLSTIK
ncbi:MAG: hypothetical protein IJF24_00125 [Clostridia bacterium]|nr:hypothetical protein [Clostridia bacterium]